MQREWSTGQNPNEDAPALVGPAGFEPATPWLEARRVHVLGGKRSGLVASTEFYQERSGPLEEADQRIADHFPVKLGEAFPSNGGKGR